MRRVLPLLAVLALAGCGGAETVTTTVSGPTVTQTTTLTVTTTPDEGDDVFRLAEDSCRAFGPLARSFGGLSGSDEDVANAYASRVDPDLRARARAGCLAGLRG